MKIVVFGPDKRVGVLLDENVVDISLACAKYLDGASVPSELGLFIEGGDTVLEKAPARRQGGLRRRQFRRSCRGHGETRRFARRHAGV